MRAQHERAHARYEHEIWDSENLPFKIHKMLHLPGNLHIEVHQVLRPHAPTTKIAHSGSHSAVPATKVHWEVLLFMFLLEAGHRY